MFKKLKGFSEQIWWLSFEKQAKADHFLRLPGVPHLDPPRALDSRQAPPVFLENLDICVGGLPPA